LEIGSKSCIEPAGPEWCCTAVRAVCSGWWRASAVDLLRWSPQGPTCCARAHAGGSLIGLSEYWTFTCLLNFKNSKLFSIVGFWADKPGWCWFVMRKKYCWLADKPWLKPTGEQAEYIHFDYLNELFTIVHSISVFEIVLQ